MKINIDINEIVKRKMDMYTEKEWNSLNIYEKTSILSKAADFKHKCLHLAGYTRRKYEGGVWHVYRETPEEQALTDAYDSYLAGLANKYDRL